MEGIIIKSTGSFYTVQTDDNIIRNCHIKGRFRIKGIKSTNPVVVGDRVSLSKEADHWMIVELHKRKNCIVRKSVNLSKQTHIIAANIDQAILMITLKSPITTTGFIDRFLTSAEMNGVNVLLIFNKLDLYSNIVMEEQKKLRIIYERIGYKCLALSVLNDDLGVLKKMMINKVNVISGHSGVGKSTLINKLQPGLSLATQKISKQHQQGQHTTTFSEMYQLDFGASIIDTPGVRGFGLVDVKKQELTNYFPEFFSLKSECRYHNCIHLNEPRCAVKKSIESGEIAISRYKNYINMLKEEGESYRTNKYD